MRVAKDTERVAVLKIKSEIVRSAGEYLREQDFIEILPVLLSPITDPLHHETYGGTVDFYGRPYQLTKSMILHKQIALLTIPRIFCFSPNVRMEPAERASFGRYLAEFVQLDLEMRDASREDIIVIGEGLLAHVLQSVSDCCGEALRVLGRDLRVPKTPFQRVAFSDAAAKHGEPFDDALSSSLSDPAWVVDFPRRVREFYDREDPERPEILLDMDLVYPEGFGEALSGGEREVELHRVLDRIERDKLPREQFALYLEYVEKGLHRCSGFGIGIERLTRYACGLERIEDARLFAKVPGDSSAV